MMSTVESWGETATVQAVQCDRCGGAIPVVQLMAHVVCPTCRSAVSIGYQWLAASSAYARQIEVLRKAYEKNHENAAIASQSDLTKNVAVLVALSIPVAMGTLAWLFGVALAVVPLIVLSTVLWAALGGPMNNVGDLRRTFARWVHRDAIAEATRAWGAATKRARCPSCGAESEIDAGSAAHTCSHCGTSLAVAVREMWVTAWSLATAVRRRAAQIGAPSPFDTKLRMDSMHVSQRGVSAAPWPQLHSIATWLGGSAAAEHLVPWLRRYWPETLPPSFLRYGGGFAWGTWRGYPVGVYVMWVKGSSPHALDPQPPFARIVIMVAAVAIDGPPPHVGQRPKIFRSCAGYLTYDDMKCHEVTTERLWWYVERLCWQAQNDGFPPPPPVDV